MFTSFDEAMANCRIYHGKKETTQTFGQVISGNFNTTVFYLKMKSDIINYKREYLHSHALGALNSVGFHLNVPHW